jgi:hypothetical protein
VYSPNIILRKRPRTSIWWRVFPWPLVGNPPQVLARTPPPHTHTHTHPLFPTPTATIVTPFFYPSFSLPSSSTIHSPPPPPIPFIASLQRHLTITSTHNNLVANCDASELLPNAETVGDCPATLRREALGRAPAPHQFVFVAAHQRNLRQSLRRLRCLEPCGLRR